MAKRLKTFQKWEGSLEDYLKVGDRVDAELVNYILGVLPPLHKKNILQLGEPISHVDGEPTYITLEQIKSDWIYKGVCFAYSGDAIRKDEDK